MRLGRSLFVLFAVAITCFAERDGDCPHIMSRTSWNARQARSVSYLILPLPYVVIHHTVTPECNSLSSCSVRIKNIQDYQMDELNWDDVGFSYFIGGDGKVYEGVGWNKEGAHTYGWNKKSAGIVFIGNFQNKEPSQTMMNAARKLIDCGKSNGSLRDDVKILGGRQVISTLSPGDKLYEKIQNWAEWGSP